MWIQIWDNILETRGRRGWGKRGSIRPGGVGFSDLGKDCIVYVWLAARRKANLTAMHICLIIIIMLTGRYVSPYPIARSLPGSRSVALNGKLKLLYIDKSKSLDLCTRSLQ